MTTLTALDLFCRWPEPRRRRVFDYVAFFVGDDGARVDAWCEAAASVLALCGRLPDCRDDQDLERELAECVRAYVDSGIIDLETIKRRSFDVAAELVRWGDGFGEN